MTLRNLAAVLALGGASATLFASLGGNHATINVAVGYASAAAVMLTSAYSYARAVRRALEADAVTYDIDRDVIEKQEDPYDLYSETDDKNPSEDIKAAIAEEKARLKAQKRSLSETLRDSKPAFSLLRLGAYGAVAVGFLYLHSRGLLELRYYLGSMALPFLLTVIYLLRRAKHV